MFIWPYTGLYDTITIESSTCHTLFQRIYLELPFPAYNSSKYLFSPQKQFYPLIIQRTRTLALISNYEMCKGDVRMMLLDLPVIVHVVIHSENPRWQLQSTVNR